MGLSGCQLQVMQALVDAGAYLDSQNTQGWTPLHRAAFNGRSEICAYLVGKGASVHSVNKEGNSALHLAAASSSIGTVEAILRAGGRVSMHNYAKKKPIGIMGVWVSYCFLLASPILFWAGVG